MRDSPRKTPPKNGGSQKMSQTIHTNPTLVFEDGTKYNGEAWKTLPWWTKLVRTVKLRQRIAAKDVSDWSPDELEIMTQKPQLYRVKSSWGFELSFGAVVIINTIVMAIKVDADDPDAIGFRIAENGFCAIFLIEWMFQIYVEGPLWMLQAANVFDTVLVYAGGVVPIWVLPAFQLTDGIWGKIGGVFTIFRCLRIFRIYRVLKKAKQRDLWMLIVGVMASMRSFGWAMVLLTVFMSVAAIFLRFVIGGDEILDTIGTAELERYFGSVPKTMWFLFGVFTNGVSWAPVANQITESRPHYWLYFAVFVCLGHFVLSNLITAVIVEHAVDNANLEVEHEAEEAQKTREKIIERIVNVFKECDINGDGSVDRKEFEKMCSGKNMQRLQRLLQMDEGGKDLLGLFDILDVDHSGYLSLDEYREVLFKIMSPPATKDVLKILMHCISIDQKLTDLGATHGRSSASHNVSGNSGHLSHNLRSSQDKGPSLNSNKTVESDCPKAAPSNAEGGAAFQRETQLLEAISVLTEQMNSVQGQLGRTTEELRSIREEMTELRQIVHSNPVGPQLVPSPANMTSVSVQERKGSSLEGSSLEGWCKPLLTGAPNANR